jgi:hypothetical protein
MKRGLLVIFAALSIWLGCPGTAGAHRLDEYLQATRLSLDLDRVGVEIDLTAGVSLAAQIFASIDTDRDGRISIAEGEAYARRCPFRRADRRRPADIHHACRRRFPELSDMSLVWERSVCTRRLRRRLPRRVSVSYLNRHAPT